jgi:nucleotide-binding universal stress UspA family protein
MSVVVGVGRSFAGLQALRFAVAEARRRGCPVFAVRVWLMAQAWRTACVQSWRTEMGDDAREYALGAFDAAMGGLPGDVDVRVLSREGVVGPTLVASAAADDLLVVGGARSIFRYSYSPQVTRYCVRHAHCPVIAVPAPDLARVAGRVSRSIARDVSELTTS